MKKQNNRSGFTIVELLIVIVVIGILAAITIVAYNGIQGRARVSAVSSALGQTTKKLALYYVDNAAYPADLSTIGIRDSESTTYQYVVNNSMVPQTYCVTATVGTTSYNQNSSSVAVSGGCAGHGVGGAKAITNIVKNPSFEIGTSQWSVGGDAGSPTATRVAGGPVGAYHVTLSKVSPVGSAQFNFVSDDLKPLTLYRLSYWAWADTAGLTGGIQLARNNVGYSPFITMSPDLTTTPTLFTATGTSPADSAQLRLRVTPRSDGSTTHYDGFMITETNAIPGYADGTYANWIWNGTAHASTSTGPSQ